MSAIFRWCREEGEQLILLVHCKEGMWEEVKAGECSVCAMPSSRANFRTWGVLSMQRENVPERRRFQIFLRLLFDTNVAKQFQMIEKRKGSQLVQLRKISHHHSVCMAEVVAYPSHFTYCRQVPPRLKPQVSTASSVRDFLPFRHWGAEEVQEIWGRACLFPGKPDEPSQSDNVNIYLSDVCLELWEFELKRDEFSSRISVKTNSSVSCWNFSLLFLQVWSHNKLNSMQNLVRKKDACGVL